jgi:hypothetical protein
MTSLLWQCMGVVTSDSRCNPRRLRAHSSELSLNLAVETPARDDWYFLGRDYKVGQIHHDRSAADFVGVPLGRKVAT